MAGQLLAGVVRSPVNSERKGSGTGRRVLSWLHRMIGLTCLLYVLMASVTGVVLLFRQELLAAVHHDLAPVRGDVISKAEELSHRLPQGSFRSIKFPDETLRAFVVYLPANRTALYNPDSLAPLPDRYGAVRFFDITFELHHYLLAGETGLILSGVFGLAITVLIGLGFYLWWWPWRRRWSIANAIPRKPTRTWRLYSHHTLGALASPALLVAAVTGAAIIFHEQARWALTELLGAGDPPRKVATSGSLSAARQQIFPDAVPRILIPSAVPGEPVTLRVRTSRELHPNGRSSIVYDHQARVAVQASEEAESGMGNRLFNLLYPLHIGSLGGLPLRLAWLISALIAFASAWLGFRSWWSRRASH